MSIFYVVPEHCEGSRYELETNLAWDASEILEHDLANSFAGDCAQDYWDNHDGWESNWPLEIHLFESMEAEQPFYKAKVRMEMSPDFFSSEVQS